MKAVIAILCLLGCALTQAEEINPARAKFNYQLFCQGCHTPDGMGVKAVPRMKDHVGYFLETRAGREYLVRVPGSATSALNDRQLAEVLNWIIIEFAGDSADPDFAPYSADEVRALRKTPLNEVENYRVQVLTEIATNRVKQAE